MTSKVEFPKWAWHRKHAPDGRIIQDESEFEELDAGWVEHPDDMDDASEPDPVDIPEDKPLVEWTDEEIEALAENDKRLLEERAKAELGIDLDLRYGSKALAGMVRQAIEAQE